MFKCCIAISFCLANGYRIKTAHSHLTYVQLLFIAARVLFLSKNYSLAKQRFLTKIQGAEDFFFVLVVGITWGKVVSMYAVAGALAVDCVRQGHATMVHILVDSLGQFVRKYLVPWLKRRGGWVRH